MIIGYDAKRVFKNFTGLGNYSRTLIETMLRFYPEHRYCLFTPALSNNPRLTDILRHPSVTIHLPSHFNQKIHPVWRSFLIKKDIQRAGVEVFHGLSHELPYRLPTKVKAIVTMHDLAHERMPHLYPYFDRKIYSLKFKHACRAADIVVAITEQTKRDILELYNIEAAKIKVIYQSCSAIFESETAAQWSGEAIRRVRSKYQLPERYVLYVGTVNERKNLLNLVKAIGLLTKMNIPLVVIGDGGSYLKIVKKYVYDNHLHPLIQFLPKLDFNDLPMLYNQARVFCLPSLYEGFGIPIIEALWSGTPVVTTEGGCFAEAGGSNTLYIDPLQPEAIAAALEKVWFDDALHAEMSNKGFQYVQRFKAELIAREWNRTYGGF